MNNFSLCLNKRNISGAVFEDQTVPFKGCKAKTIPGKASFAHVLMFIFPTHMPVGTVMSLLKVG